MIFKTSSGGCADDQIALELGNRAAINSNQSNASTTAASIQGETGFDTLVTPSTVGAHSCLQYQIDVISLDARLETVKSEWRLAIQHVS